MPTSVERKRGGVIKYRTKRLSNGRYIRIAIVRKPGKRGGRTVAGKVRRKHGK
jgi:hypothetical protein